MEGETKGGSEGGYYKGREGWMGIGGMEGGKKGGREWGMESGLEEVRDGITN